MSRRPLFLVLGILISISFAVAIWRWWPTEPGNLPVLRHEQVALPAPPGRADDLLGNPHNPSCPPLTPPIAVALPVRGDDGMTQAFHAALSKAVDAAPVLYRVDGTPECTLVVFIPDHVTWREDNGRTMISYRVNVWQQGGPDLGSYTGSCWLDEVDKCATQAKDAVLSTVKMRH